MEEQLHELSERFAFVLLAGKFELCKEFLLDRTVPQFFDLYGTAIKASCEIGSYEVVLHLIRVKWKTLDGWIGFRSW